MIKIKKHFLQTFFANFVQNSALEEHVNREKISLETKKASFETRVEEFEVKMAKEQLHIEQQRKDLKLAQNIFEEKKTYWEYDKQREKEYLTNYKQELEVYWHVNLFQVHLSPLGVLGSLKKKLKKIFFNFY